MHDKNGTALRVGDVITIEYVITSASGGEDFCNVTARSTATRRPDDQHEFYSGNSAVAVLQRRAAP